MENILCCIDFYDTIEKDGSNPTIMSDSDWKKVNKKTVRFIR